MYYIFEKVNIEWSKLKLIKNIEKLKKTLIEIKHSKRENKNFVSIKIDFSLENKINPKKVSHKIEGSIKCLIVTIKIKDLDQIIKTL